MISIPQKMLAIHQSLDTAGIPHAFGGALALAWCTQRARGTIDIDLNVFVGTDRTIEVLDALPEGVVWTDDRRALTSSTTASSACGGSRRRSTCS